jgi:hypothetical protein
MVQSVILNALQALPELIDKLSALTASTVLPLMHFFSNSDNAKKLREIPRQLNAMEQNRLIDQRSALKTIYQRLADERMRVLCSTIA